MAAEEIPPVIPDFVLLRRIGAGSYGEVWLARGVTGMFRAVKIIYRSSFISERPYQREFDGVSRYVGLAAGEPSQLAVLHAGQAVDGSYFFYVMELADDVERGREIKAETYVPLTLQHLQEKAGGRLATRRCLEVGLSLATGLATLHRHGLVHRDIKPSNVVLVGGVPKLADIGLVAPAEAGRTFVGTETYGAPEGPGQPAADVFSLARVLYELWSGRSASEWPSGLREAEKGEREEAEWAAVLERAGSFVVAKRHEHATALRDDLLLLQAGRSVRRLRLAEQTAVRLRRGLVAALVVGLVAGAAAVLAIRVERDRAEVANAGKRQAEEQRDALARRTVYAAELARAQRALENDDYGAARRHLKAAVPTGGDETLKGFEWHVLWKQAQGNATRILRESGPGIEQIEAGDDFETAWTLNASGVVEEWREGLTESLERARDVHRILGPFRKGKEGIVCQRRDGRIVFVSPDSREEFELVISPSDLGSAKIVKQKLFWLDAHGTPTIHVVDLSSFKTENIDLPVGGGDWIIHRQGIAFAESGTMVSVILMKGLLTTAEWRWLVVDLPSGVVRVDEKPKSWFGATSMSPNGELAVVGDVDTHTVQFWNAKSGIFVSNTIEKADLVRPLEVFDNGSVCYWSNSGVVSLVNGRTEESQWRLTGLHGNAAVRTGSLLGDRVWGADKEGRVQFWSDFNRARSPMRLSLPPGGGISLSVANDCRSMMLATPAEGLVSLDLEHGDRRKFASDSYLAIGYSCDGLDAFLVSADGSSVERRNVLANMVVWRRELGLDHIATYNISPEGRAIAVMDQLGRARVIDEAGGMKGSMNALNEFGTGICLGPEGSWLAVSSSDGTVRLWSTDGTNPRLVSERKVKGSRARGGYNMMIASPDGQHFAGLVDGTESVVESVALPSLEVTSTHRILSGAAYCLAINPQGNRLVYSARAGGLEVMNFPWLEPLTSITPLLNDSSVSTDESVAVFDFSRSAPGLAGLYSNGKAWSLRW